jgi:hypothetical protein
MLTCEKNDPNLSNSEVDDEITLQDLKISSLACEGGKLAGVVVILESKVNSMATHNTVLEENLTFLSSECIDLRKNVTTSEGTFKGQVDILTADNKTLEGRVDILTADNKILTADIKTLEGRVDILTADNKTLEFEFVILRSHILEERKEKACKEIVFGVQDVNAKSRLETNRDVKMKGLSEVFKTLRGSRHDVVHLFREGDPPDIVIYKKAAFVRILENSNCLKDDLVAEGITSDVIAVVLDVLRNELKDVTLRIPQLAEVTKVEKFFKNTLLTLEKKCIKDLYQEGHIL